MITWHARDLRRVWALLMLTTVVVVVGCDRGTAPRPLTPSAIRFDGQTMGTTYHVQVAQARLAPEQQKEIHAQIDAALAEVNRQMSTYDPQSEISRFNASRSVEPFPVSLATAQVVAAAMDVYRESNGCFDVTVGPLVELWGFGAAGRRHRPPTDQEIDARRQSVGSDKLRVTLDPPSLQKSVPQTHVDLSAIAKGYGVDVVSQLLRRYSLEHHLVEIGGEIAVRGLSPRGDAWRLDIEQPSLTADANQQRHGLVLTIQNAALATSGDYRNYFEEGQQRFSHTIDPRTGKPVMHRLASVTIVAPSCMRADALATATLVMGPEKGLEWLESQPDVEGLLLVRDASGELREFRSRGMDRYLKPTTK